MSRYIVKKEFMFTTYDSPEPVRIEKGNLISYMVYTNEHGIGYSNAVKITVHGPNGDIILDGPNRLYLGEYLREVEFNDLACSKEYMFEQQKDRTYRHGVTKNYAFVDNPDKVVEDGKYEEYKRKRIDIGTILDYHNRIDYKPLSKDVIQFLQSEKERLDKEYDKLTLLVLSDTEIAIRALSHMRSDCLKNYDMDVVHKIEDVISRLLDMTEDKGEE